MDTLPSAMRLRQPQVTFSEMLRLSSWARLDMMVIISSPLLSRVSMFSFSNVTPIPFSFSFRMVVRLSTVFRAKRLTLLVMIRSIFPASASAISRLKPSRRAVEVAEMPSSVYRPAYSHSGLFRIRLP